MTNGVISYLLFSFLSLGRRFLAYDGKEEDKDVYLLLSPPMMVIMDGELPFVMLTMTGSHL